MIREAQHKESAAEVQGMDSAALFLRAGKGKYFWKNRLFFKDFLVILKIVALDSISGNDWESCDGTAILKRMDGRES